MPGWITNGLPPVSAPVQNGVTINVGGINVNGIISGGETLTYTQLGASALFSSAFQKHRDQYGWSRDA